MDTIATETAIKSLLVRERYYRDTNQWEKLRSSYHPDASKTHIDITWYQGDIDGFVSGSRAMVTGGTGAIHSISPVEVYISTNGDRAVTESTGSISIRFAYEGRSYDCVSLNRFISRLERESGQWKLLTLESIYERDSITPVLPESGNVTLPVPVEARESYRCISWVLSLKGFKIKQDLPGADDPASCEWVMKEGLEWLSE